MILTFRARALEPNKYQNQMEVKYMENASKALIIAGAILISILLISVGVLIMNSTGDTQKSVEDQSKAIAIRTFNAQFTPYEGSDQSASQIRALKSAVQSSNGTNVDHQVVFELATGVTITSKDKYNVELTYGSDNNNKGYVTKVTVSK